ncbi:MAG TPA: sulfotransferase [Bacteroidales bacterium]|nr:sulfotransferase [Bacteroidales bacterium]
MENIKEIPIFFILGRPRSGTTLLTTLFNAHPNVRIAPEFPILLPLYQRFKKVKDWDEEAIRSFVDHLFRRYVFNNRTLDHYMLDQEKYTNDLLEMKHTGTVQDFLKTINYQSFTVYEKGKTLRIGDKNPVYSIYARRLLKIFPEAKFICIIRDYRDNFVSIRKLSELKMEAPILPLQVYRWKYAIKEFLHCKKKYPDRFHLIRYEDLVTDQERVVKEVFEYIGIPYDPSVFDFYKKKDESFKAYNDPLIEKFHGSLMNPVNTSRMNLWKKELTPAQVRMADFIAGKYADMFHYDRENRHFRLGLWLKSIPMQVYGYFLFRLMYYGSFLPYKMSLWLSTKLLILVKTYSKLFGSKAPAGQSKK